MKRLSKRLSCQSVDLSLSYTPLPGSPTLTTAWGIHGEDHVKASRVQAGPFRGDSQRCRIYYRGRSFSLTRTEYAIFWELASQPGSLVRREDLLKKLWRGNKQIQARTIDLHVSHIRRKLNTLQLSSGPTIQTVWGLGYRLKLPLPPQP